jgi:hypothetical protein
MKPVFRRISAWVSRVYLFFLKYQRLFLYGVILLGFVFLTIVGLSMIAQSRQQSAQIEALTKENKKITLQNQKLSHTTIELADRNIYYSKCIALILARFTQNPTIPIKIRDITKCEVEAGRVGREIQSIKGNNTAIGNSSANGTSTPSSKANPTKPNPPVKQPPEEAPPSQPQQPSQPSFMTRIRNAVDGLLDLVGVK